MKKHNETGDGWENCHIPIRCLWDHQKTSGNLGFAVTFFHRNPVTATTIIQYAQASGIVDRHTVLFV